jgi:YidC/Oxa1 family membrane protein insertase
MFTTQLQLMRKNMPKEALTGQAAQMQKVMLYVFPVFFLIGGFNFPIGVLIYWFVSNLWTMGQQFYVIRRNPAPGTPAYDSMQARKREHNVRHGKPADEGVPGTAGAATETETDRRPAQRQQPKRQSRSDRKGGPAAGGANGSDSTASSNGQTSAPQDEPRPQDAPKTQGGAAKKQPAGSTKRQPAAKSAAQKRAAQKRAAQKRSGGSR